MHRVDGNLYKCSYCKLYLKKEGDRFVFPKVSFIRYGSGKYKVSSTVSPLDSYSTSQEMKEVDQEWLSIWLRKKMKITPIGWRRLDSKTQDELIQAFEEDVERGWTPFS